MRKILAALILLAPLASAAFYVKDKQYRFPKGDPRCDVKKHCDSEVWRAPDGSNQDYSLNFIEIRGNGKRYDDGQLERAKAQIDVARAGGQTPLVFVYIHGWHNNAGEEDNPKDTPCLKLKGDVAKFRECGLKEVAQRYPTRPGSPPAVVGIYLAWQGTDFTKAAALIPYFVPSYMLRRYAATHVGMNGMCDSLDKLLTVTNNHRDQYIVLLMGHSFGARVLEHADEKLDPKKRNCDGTLARDRKQQKEAAARSATPARSSADLVFYVNAAATRTITLRTIRDLNDLCKMNPAIPVCKMDPMYMAFTSRTDIPTGFIMLVANLAFSWWPIHFDPFRMEIVPISAGNTEELHTHYDPKNLGSGNCPTPAPPSSLCFQVPTGKEVPGQDTYYLKPISQTGQKRFWVFNTGHAFIMNHGDVWNPKLFGLVLEILNRNQNVAAGKRRNSQ